MMSYWAEFAYNGDPNKGRKGDLTEWESWDPSEDSNKFIVFDSKFDGGIRMTEDSLTEENLIEMLAMDDRIKDKKWKCEILDAAIMFDKFADQDLLKEFNNQQCIGFDPASEWRKYWYDEKKKRF